MPHKKKTLLYVIILFFAACSTPEEKSAEVSLRFVKEVSFDIDSMTPSFPDGNASIFRHQGKEYYVHGNKKKFCLQFFDIQAQKFAFEVPLQREGEDGIGSFNHFFVKSLDSIYVVYSHTYSMWRVNKEGKIQQKYNWAEQAKGGIVQGIGEEVLNKADTLYFITSDYNYPDYFITQWLCLKTGNVGFRYTLPEIYKKGTYLYGAFFPSRCEGKDGTLIFSFELDAHLYQASYEDTSLKKTMAINSKYVQVKPVGKKAKDLQEVALSINKDIQENPLFVKIMYDKYRKVYYRIVKLGRKVGAETEVMTIIILDEKFNIIGEHYFDEKLHLNYGITLISENGLWVALTPSHPSFNEDKIMFHCYVPEISK